MVSAADAAQTDSDGAGGQDTIYLCAGKITRRLCSVSLQTNVTNC